MSVEMAEGIPDGLLHPSQRVAYGKGVHVVEARAVVPLHSHRIEYPGGSARSPATFPRPPLCPIPIDFSWMRETRKEKGKRRSYDPAHPRSGPFFF